MKNINQWEASKFVFKKGKLRASNEPKDVNISSRLITNLIAEFYDDNLKKYASGKLIDLGCGKVPLYDAYKDYITENICVDWENSMHKNIFLDYECDITEKLPFKDEEFDTVILSDVLEHIPKPDVFIKEVSRITKQGGYILLNVPFFYWLHETPHDYYRYTEHALIRFANIANFEVLSLQSIGGTPEILADILSKHILKLPVFGEILARFIQFSTYHLMNINIIKKISLKTEKKFPFGYSMIMKKLPL